MAKAHGAVTACQHHIARVPGKLELPRVVIVSRRHQATRKRLKDRDLIAVIPQTVNHLHGRHVVDARIEPHLIEHQNTRPSDLLFLLPHVLRLIRGRYHVFFMFDAR